MVHADIAGDDGVVGQGAGEGAHEAFRALRHLGGLGEGGALFKLLVTWTAPGHGISMYQPRAYVAPRSHKVQEQVYHVLEGEGPMEIEDARRVVRRHDVIFIPPGIRHAIHNMGLTNLVFLVVTAPVSDD